MRHILAIFAFGLASVCANADDFGQQLSDIQKQSVRIRSHLGRLGIRSNEDEPLANYGERSKKPTQLFEVHGDAKARQASEGQVVFGHLVNRLVVSSEPHPTLIKLDSNQGIFSGLTIKGSAHQGANPDRVQIELGKLILRSGRAVQISGQVLDSDGALGIKADVLSAKMWAESGALAGSFVSGVASASQSQTINGLGFASVTPTGRNALLGGVAQSAADGSKRLLEEATKEKPVLIVEPGGSISVMFSEELRL